MKSMLKVVSPVIITLWIAVSGTPAYAEPYNLVCDAGGCTVDGAHWCNNAISIADNSVTPSKIGIQCAIGQVLVRMVSGWQCGTLSIVDNGISLCGASECAYICNKGSTACPTGCVNTANDRQNCGTCGNACAGTCVASACQPPTCIDGILNNFETDVDCGGTMCSACQNGKTCGNGGDCISLSCINGICAAESQPNGTPCSLGGQCQTGYCVEGYCCDSACNGSCQSCAINPGYCTAALAGTDPKFACGPFNCNGTNSSCPTTCSSSADCKAPANCVLNICF